MSWRLANPKPSQPATKRVKLPGMRWLRLAPVLGLIAACGGSATRDGKGSLDVAGAAGQPSNDAGGSSGAVPVSGGAGGGAAGTHAEAGTNAAGTAAEAGTSAAGAGGAQADGGAAGQSSPGCEGFACLADAELVYWPDREWQRSGMSSGGNELLEADYAPKEGPAWDVKFSSDAQQLTLTPRAGGDPVQGTRDAQRTDRAWFDVRLSIGGRFVVKGVPPEFQAEFTAYGSGVPITQSTRGALKAP